MRERQRFNFAGMVIIALVCAARIAAAHEAGGDEEGPTNLHEMWRTWGWEPGTLIGLALSAWLYAAGIWRLWRASGVGRGIRRWEAWSFCAGWVVLFIALVSPLHPLGQVLFSAHMTQHELLMLVAAPLLVLGRPVVATLHALPAPVAQGLGRAANSAPWRTAWSVLSAPMVAWLLHAIVLWAWHAPALFQATLHSEWIHAAQHLSFLLTALLFWWAIIHDQRRLTNYGAAILYLFTTAMHSGLLGALITFAGTVWYPDYADRTNAWGIAPLDDQQFGGLIMWVPACIVYIVAALVMVAGWLRQSEARALRREMAASLSPSPAVPIVGEREMS